MLTNRQTDLSFACTCTNGTAPALASYTDTLPYVSLYHMKIMVNRSSLLPRDPQNVSLIVWNADFLLPRSSTSASRHSRSASPPTWATPRARRTARRASTTSAAHSTRPRPPSRQPPPPRRLLVAPPLPPRPLLPPRPRGLEPCRHTSRSLATALLSSPPASSPTCSRSSWKTETRGLMLRGYRHAVRRPIWPSNRVASEASSCFVCPFCH